MHRLTAFEFITGTDEPQLIVLKRGETVLLRFSVLRWLSIDLCEVAFFFVSPADLTIEGMGIGRPYWNGEVPLWRSGDYDPYAEQERIATICAAAQRHADQQRSVM